MKGGLRTKGDFKKSQEDIPLISIITVVFNGKKYLEETIQSVIDQTYDNVEYIIIDGGSNDGTIDIIKKYDNQIDYWVSEIDKGLSDAMNKGVKCSKGDYIMHLHADDILSDGLSLEKLIQELKNNTKVKWISGFYRYINANSEIFRKDKNLRSYDLNDMLMRNIIRHQSTLVPKYFFEKFEFNSQYKYAMDYDFFLNSWYYFGNPFFVEDYITNFRLDGTNLSSNFYASIRDEMKVRLNFRIANSMYRELPYDFIIFSLRLFKLFIYHYPKKYICR